MRAARSSHSLAGVRVRPLVPTSAASPVAHAEHFREAHLDGATFIYSDV
jgi:hypothetical protein